MYICADVTFTSHVESPHRMTSVSSTKDAKHDDSDNGSEEVQDDPGHDDDLSIATITDDDDDETDEDRDRLAAR